MKLVTPEKLRELAKIKASYQSADAYAISEPRIEMILKRLSALLDVVTLEVDGKPVEADGFRLRNPSDWAQPSPSIMTGSGLDAEPQLPKISKEMELIADWSR